MNSRLRMGALTRHGLAMLLAGLSCLSYSCRQETKAPATGSLRERAEQGDAVAQRFLGLRYYRGLGVKQDYAEALRWFHKAAGQGDADAQFSLGFEYYDGRKVAKDNVAALMWMILASRGSGGGGQSESQEIITHFRRKLSGEMTSQQIAEAERRARAWTSKTGRQSK
jgi:TPR repeat protein